MLVEGVMEGQYTGIREVNSDADIYILKKYSKEKKEKFLQENTVKTGVSNKSTEIYIRKLKIFFNKGVTKFKNYDTIKTYKKVKLFSNYYMPFEMIEITNFETIKKEEKYTEQQLTEKITKELQEELNQELGIQDSSQVKSEITSQVEEDGVMVKLVYSVEEKIGTKES